MGFKKRYIVLGLLALEVASLPFAGHIIHKQALAFDTSRVTNPQHAVHVKLKSPPGLTRFMVYATGAFAVTSENAIGTLDVRVSKSGLVNGQPYGANAQLPGARLACVVTKNARQETIYASERGTMLQDGDILSKTVLVSIHYDETLTPDIKILTQKKSAKLSPAPLCDKSGINDA